MRGDQCRFDHGNDAVVLEESGPNTSVPPPYLPGRAPPDPYVPSGAPGAPVSVMPPLHLPPPGYAGRGRKRSYGDSDTSYPPSKRFDYKRLGGRGGGRGGGAPLGGRVGNLPPNASSQIIVKGVPPQLNTIAHMNNHYARFGTLVNVQVHYEGDPSTALVSFANPMEANAAMKSSEAVLGNRFIKMFYHTTTSPKKRTPVKDRLGVSGETVTDETAQGGTITKTIVNKDAVSTSPESQAETEAMKENQKAAVIDSCLFSRVFRCLQLICTFTGNCCNQKEPGGPGDQGQDYQGCR